MTEADADASADRAPRAANAGAEARGLGLRPGRLPPALLLGGLTVALAVAMVAAAATGAFSIPPLEVVGAVFHRAGIDIGTRATGLEDDVLWEIRFPRVMLAVLVGACLGAAGAAMQGTFSNPLAEPGVVGVSSGAVLGAVAQIVLNINIAGEWSIVVAAFAGGLVTVFFVYVSSRAQGRTEVVTLVLTGIAVNALVGALIGLFTFYSDDAELRTITFWTLGSMAQATWSKVLVVLPVAVLGLALALWNARRLDLLTLGERPASHLGVDVERLRITMLLTVALLTAAAVAMSGILLFVGLVIPHLMRMVGGPGHRLLLPASALAGATILVFADLAARTLNAPAELPLGVLTALVGSPFFLWQLRRTRESQGGWA